MRCLHQNYTFYNFNIKISYNFLFLCYIFIDVNHEFNICLFVVYDNLSTKKNGLHTIKIYKYTQKMFLHRTFYIL